MTTPSSFESPLPVDIILSVATIPVLVGLVGARMLSQSVVELGRMSEEIFRGDRLPVLNLSNAVNASDETPTS